MKLFNIFEINLIDNDEKIVSTFSKAMELLSTEKYSNGYVVETLSKGKYKLIKEEKQTYKKYGNYNKNEYQKKQLRDEIKFASKKQSEINMENNSLIINNAANGSSSSTDSARGNNDLSKNITPNKEKTDYFKAQLRGEIIEENIMKGAKMSNLDNYERSQEKELTPIAQKRRAFMESLVVPGNSGGLMMAPPKKPHSGGTSAGLQNIENIDKHFDSFRDTI